MSRLTCLPCLLLTAAACLGRQPKEDPVGPSLDGRELVAEQRKWRDKLTAAHLVAFRPGATKAERDEWANLLAARDKTWRDQGRPGVTIRVTAVVRQVERMPDNDETGERQWLVRMAASDRAVLPPTEDSFECQTVDEALVGRLRLGQTASLRGRFFLYHNVEPMKGNDRSKDPGIILRVVNCVEAPK